MVRPPAGEEASTTECTGARNRRAERRRKGVAASEEKSKHPRGEGNNSPLSSRKYSHPTRYTARKIKKKREITRTSKTEPVGQPYYVNLSLDFFRLATNGGTRRPNTEPAFVLVNPAEGDGGRSFEPRPVGRLQEHRNQQ